MPLKRPVNSLKKAILIPTYKREEYFEKCLKSIVKAQEYPNTVFYIINDGGNPMDLDGFELPFELIQHEENRGLRTSIIEFFEWVKENPDIDFISKIDSDCEVPKNWLNDILSIFDKHDVDILSPNVYPSNAAYRYGTDVGLPYIPAKIVGGLWNMSADLIRDMLFVKYPIDKLKGALAVLRQIVNEKDPKIGWAKEVVFQDIGHWSGQHPECIKNREHESYYHEVGRDIAWQA